MRVVALVMAKAPVPGEAKTRLALTQGSQRAAELASAALLDTLDACESAFGAGDCHLALTGDLARAHGSAELTRRLATWSVRRQHGDGFAQRLVRAHRDVAARSGAAVIQIGMDTPQVTASDLLEVAGLVADHDAVVGPATDGGWWVLGSRSPRWSDLLVDIPMSSPQTGQRTVAALAAAGATVALAPVRTDVDTGSSAEEVARLAPMTRFGRAWAGHRQQRSRAEAS